MDWEVPTAELDNAIHKATDVEDYLAQNRGQLLNCTLSGYLKELLRKKKLKRAQAVRDSLLDRAYAYQIFSGLRTPSRDKLIALVFGMHLSEAEGQRLLRISGNRELYARDERDVLILFSLQRGMGLFEANEPLAAHGFAAIGAPND